MGRKVELKLEVPPKTIGALKRMRSLRRGNGHARDNELVSVYFDTAEHMLRKHGMSLRVRHIGDERVQTVKANGPSAAGLFQRSEWETPIRSDTPDLRAMRRTAIDGLLTKKLARALKPVFETRVHRFFASLFDRRRAHKRLRRFERQLESLQDCLGALNDIAVHERLAGKVVGRNGRRRQRAFAIGLVSGREQSRVAPLRAAAERAADRFGAVRPFWN